MVVVAGRSGAGARLGPGGIGALRHIVTGRLAARTVGVALARRTPAADDTGRRAP
jgi:hypothetical protein